LNSSIISYTKFFVAFQNTLQENSTTLAMRNAFKENFVFVNFENQSKFIASMKGVVDMCIQKI
jgi:hypothetical protein